MTNRTRVMAAVPTSTLDAALAVSYATVLWALLAGTASVVAGIRAGSGALVGVGASIATDLISSVVLIMRFRREKLTGEIPHRAEGRAHVVAATALLIVGAGLLIGGAERLAASDSARPTALSLALAAASLVVLPVLARAKYAVAIRVVSSALRTDAHITAVGTAIAGVTLLGLAATSVFHWWWADPAATIVVGGVAGWLGVTGLSHRVRP